AVIPYARPGIIGGCFIALGRALGETMAVTMLIGNKPEISLSPFSMGYSIASAIANQFTEATNDLYLSALTELGLVLLVVSMLVNSLARVLLRRVNSRRQVGRGLRRFAPPVPAALELSSGGVISRVMPCVLGACFLATTVPLFLILGYLIYRGAGALS